MKHIEIPDRIGYQETLEMVQEISRRVNLLMSTTVFVNQTQSVQQFLFSENRIQLNISDRRELETRIEAVEDAINGT